MKPVKKVGEKEEAYRSGRLVGMKLAARILQKIYSERMNTSYKFNAMDARELFAKECEKEGFDMFQYLRDDFSESQRQERIVRESGKDPRVGY